MKNEVSLQTIFKKLYLNQLFHGEIRPILIKSEMQDVKVGMLAYLTAW